MVYTVYDLRFCIDWTKGGKLRCSDDSRSENLKDIFSQLYTTVVEESLDAHALGKIPEKPEIIKEIRIKISKKRVKAITVNREKHIISPDKKELE